MPDFQSKSLTIDGMHCDSCVSRVTQALGSVPGVRLHSVAVGEAKLLAEPACESLIREAVEKAGFTLTGMRGEG